MKRRLLLLVILFIFFISTLTLLLIINYLDPYRDKLVSLVSITLTFVLSFSSFLTILFYLFKKVYYRWEVFLNHIFTSLRQWLLTSFFVVWLLIFNSIWVLSISTISLLFVILLFIELLFQNISWVN